MIHSLGRKIFALATGIVVAASTLSIWAGSRSASRALLEQVEVDGQLLGTVIGQAISRSEKKKTPPRRTHRASACRPLRDRAASAQGPRFIPS